MSPMFGLKTEHVKGPRHRLDVLQTSYQVLELLYPCA